MSRSAPWLTALLQTAILLTAVGCAAPWRSALPSSVPTLPRSGDIALTGHLPRPVYNGSVVPGGVYTIVELRAAIARDPIVAEHYRGVDLDAMRAVTLTAGKAAYVSYRRGDRTHWTRERLWLKAGETVLTDGTTTIRARCGNCVSDAKQARVAAVEPAHGELDDFVVPPTPETGVDAFAADAEVGLGDLLEVPFAADMLARLEPGGPLLIPGLLEDPFGGGLSPFFPPPLIVPGGGNGGDGPGGPPPGPGFGGPGLPGGGGGGGGDVPPVPPAGLVPGDGGTGSPGTSTGGPGGATGVPGGSSTTGDTGSATTSSGEATTGVLTDGSPFTTTVDVSTSSTGAAPEPGMLWLVACGALGLAGRRYRAQR